MKLKHTANDDNALIQSLRIAAPCNVSWDSMSGDERKRLCGQCKLHVYNIERMTTSEAVSLIRGKEEVCIQLYRRKDGTILTENCPVGLRKIRDRIKKSAAAIAVFLVWVGFSKPALADEPQSQQFYERGKRVALPLPAPTKPQPRENVCMYGADDFHVMEKMPLPNTVYNVNQLLALFFASTLSVFGIIFLALARRSRPSTIGTMLLAIWALTGFLLGILSSPH